MINGKKAGVEIKPGIYAKINRVWKKGDVISLNMPMDITLIEGNPLIEEVRNQVAIKRGPIVYCVETPDLPKNAGILDVYLPEDSKLRAQYRPDVLGGVCVIDGEVTIRKDTQNGMYHTANKPEWEKTTIQFVPYFAWSNRGASDMTVWLPVMWGK
mgnify:CR=1 FL=1